MLFGDVVPAGKLPVTFARSADQCPPLDHGSRSVVYEYDAGYRFVDRNGFEPRYPFGFGLSYTTFALAGSSDGTIRAELDATNTGGLGRLQQRCDVPLGRAERALKSSRNSGRNTFPSSSVEIPRRRSYVGACGR